MPRRFFLLAWAVMVQKFAERRSCLVSAVAGNRYQMIEFQYADDLSDEEYPDDVDASDELDDSTQTFCCPECGSEIYEDAPQCAICGHYVTAHDRSSQGWWWVAMVTLLIVSLLLWLL